MFPSYSINQQDPIKDRVSERRMSLGLFAGSPDLPPAESKTDPMRAHVTGSLNLLVSTVSQLEGHLQRGFFPFLFGCT